MRQKNTPFPRNIFLMLLMVLVLVIITGTFAYRQFSAIVSEITEKAKPDKFLLGAKSVMNDVYTADNCVKSYRLTEDNSYKLQFYTAVNKTENQLDVLRTQYKSEERIKDIDSMTSLIEEKFLLLNELLEADKLFRAQEALDKVSFQFEPDLEQNSLDPEDQNYIERGRAFIEKLIKGRQSKNGSNRIDLENLQEELAEIKEEEQSIELLIKQEELILIDKDRFLTVKLENLLDYLELIENQQIERTKREATKAMQRTNTQVVLFCIAAGILLLLMAYILANYMRKNNEYRQLMKKARQQAEQLALNKERFLATMSHEIRTPMNSIKGFAEQLSKSKLSSQQKEQLEIIKESSDYLSYVVNDILDLTKMDMGKVKLNAKPFLLDQTLSECMQLMKPLFKKQGNEFQFHTNFDSDLCLLGDANKLKQILINLLSNANKFTSKGEINLNAWVEILNTKDVHLMLEIKDNGVGMTEEQLSRAFDEFEQFDSEVSGTFKGSGLGLNIVKRLVHLCKGTINLTSKLNVGTKVEISLPYSLAEMEKRVVAKSSLVLPHGLSILIVDDEEYNRKLITTILSNSKATITEAKNGKEALELAANMKFDILLMDTRMPVMNGIDASLALRNSGGINADTPILVVTAAVTEQINANFAQIRHCSILKKPFNERELITAIDQTLKQEFKTFNSHTEPVQDKKPVDFDELRLLSNNNKAFYIDMLETFITSCEDGLKHIQEANLKSEFSLVSDLAHKMCSPCRHLSANHLLTTLKALEKASSKGQIDALTLKAKKEFEHIKPYIEAELKSEKNKHNQLN